MPCEPARLVTYQVPAPLFKLDRACAGGLKPRADFFVKGHSDCEISADDLLSPLVYMWTQTPPRYEAIFLILPVLLCLYSGAPYKHVEDHEAEPRMPCEPARLVTYQVPAPILSLAFPTLFPYSKAEF
jgi:hypothetical protein